MIDLETTDNFAFRVFNNIGIKHTKKKTLLVIGSRPNSTDYICQWFIDQGYKATIIEVLKSNVELLRAKGLNVIEGDVRAAELGDYDYVVWWNGPDIVKEDITAITEKLKKIAKECLIYATQYKTTNDSMTFLGLGMKEYHWGEAGAPNCKLIAYWKAEE